MQLVQTHCKSRVASNQIILLRCSHMIAEKSGSETKSWNLQSYLPQLKEHFGPIRQNLTGDLLASVVVFLVALPLCMGIAIASGVPPALGLISGIVGGVVISVISGSPLLVSGPAAGLAVLIWELVQAHGILALGPVVLFAGLIQMAAGSFGLGMWFRAVSPSVIHGMLAGIGVSIMANQFYVMMDAQPLGNGLKNLLLYPGYIERLFESLMTLPPTTWLQPIAGSTAHLALGIGLLAVAVTVFWAKLAPKALRVVPSALVAVVATSAVAWLLQLPIHYVTIPANLVEATNFISFAHFGDIFHGPMFTAALAIAFIASAETLLSASAVDKMHDGVRTKYDQELFAQGVGNSVCGLLGALPMTGVIARSGANVTAGAKTRTSAFVHGLWLLLFVGLFSGILQFVPIAGLAGVLVVIGAKLINPDHIRHLKEYGKSEVAIYWITLGTIIATDLLDGVLIGIGLAFAKLLYSLLHLDISMVKDRASRRAIMNLRGAATFIQLPKLAKALDKVPDNAELHVNIHDLNYVDHACLDLLESWAEQHKSTGGQLVIEWDALASRYKKRATDNEQPVAVHHELNFTDHARLEQLDNDPQQPEASGGQSVMGEDVGTSQSHSTLESENIKDADVVLTDAGSKHPESQDVQTLTSKRKVSSGHTASIDIVEEPDDERLYQPKAPAAKATVSTEKTATSRWGKKAVSITVVGVGLVLAALLSLDNGESEHKLTTLQDDPTPPTSVGVSAAGEAKSDGASSQLAPPVIRSEVEASTKAQGDSAEKSHELKGPESQPSGDASAVADSSLGTNTSPPTARPDAGLDSHRQSVVQLEDVGPFERVYSESLGQSQSGLSQETGEVRYSKPQSEHDSQPVVDSKDLQILKRSEGAAPTEDAIEEKRMAGLPPQGRNSPVTDDKSQSDFAAFDTAPETSTIDRLLDLARKSFEDHRLTTPRRDSAQYYYSKALELDAQNREAKAGLHEIAKRYGWWAQREIDRQNYSKASKFITRGLGMDPANQELLALKGQISKKQ